MTWSPAAARHGLTPSIYDISRGSRTGRFQLPQAHASTRGVQVISATQQLATSWIERLPGRAIASGWATCRPWHSSEVHPPSVAEKANAEAFSLEVPPLIWFVNYINVKTSRRLKRSHHFWNVRQRIQLGDISKLSGTREGRGAAFGR
jgi:hypothetical protein